MLQWLREHDPNWFGLHRAIRAAVVVPSVFAVGSELIGNAQFATFGAFGSFAMLLFVNFTGGLATRAGAYLGLGAVGVVLISLGTVLATPDWLAVIAMAVVAFAVLFAGVVSSLISGATQAALLAFILAVMLPGGRADLPARLGGWGLAVAVAVPVALFLWPPRDQDQLRLRASVLCRALGDLLSLEQPSQGDTLVAMRQAARELRATFRTSATRTAGLSTGARLLIRLVAELEWLAAAVVNACADAPAQWSGQGRRLRTAATRVLMSCDAALGHRGAAPDERCRADLDERLVELDAARRAVIEESLADLRDAPSAADGERTRGEFDRPLYAAHELGYVVALVGGTVSAISAADARSWWERLLGRRVTEDELGVIAVAKHSALGQLNRHAVWLQNSIRGAVGLALAVLLSRVVDAQNAFWVGLGALSVLRSTALSTGSTALRALLGTALGFAIGGALVSALGTSHAVLWPLLPLLVFIAAAAPNAISFVAGQAAFTVVIIVLFNIIAPIGWKIGVVRIEDVALGCLASLGAGFLFWPRGAGAALGSALGEAYESAATYLRQAVAHVTGRRVDPPDAGQEAMAAGERLDEALREYFAEQGGKRVPLESVALLAHGAARVRFAGTAIKRLQYGEPDDRPTGGGALDGPASALDRRADQVTRWYEALGAGFALPDNALPTDGHASSDGSFLEVVLPVVQTCEDGQRAQAELLLWSGQYLGDVDQLREELIEPAGQVTATSSHPWWAR